MAHSFYVLACSVGMYGLCLGCWFLLVPVLLADQYGTDKISSSYGLVRMFQSVGAISIPPLAGKTKKYFRDNIFFFNSLLPFQQTLGIIYIYIYIDMNEIPKTSELPRAVIYLAIYSAA